MSALHGTSSDPGVPGVLGENTAEGGRGVVGNGFTATGVGVLGQNGAGVAVYGNSGLSTGVVGESNQPNGQGVLGENRAEGGRGIVGNGFTATGIGVLGQNGAGDAVFGNSGSGRGVVGLSNSQAGVVGESQSFDGVYGISHNPSKAGVSGHNLDAEGKDNPNGLAGWFGGNVVVTGDVQLTGGQDCSELLDTAGTEVCTPGTVMTIDDTGVLVPSSREYDTRAAGVIAGALDLRPGLILGQHASAPGRVPIALVGTVFCKVVADKAPIAIGDLLTTSSVRGRAMKAGDPSRALGTIIGKALQSLPSGVGMIRILIALQ